MSEQELQDSLLMAVRRARPAIDDVLLAPTSADAVQMLERVVRGERVRRRRLPAFRGMSRPRIGAIAIAATAAVAAAVFVLSGISGGPSLVARAYADLNAGYVVVHEVDIQTDPRLHGYYDRTEGWLLPADGRTRMINVSGYEQHPYRTVTEVIVTATGRVFARSCLAGCNAKNVGAFINGRSRWAYEGAGIGFGMTGAAPGTFAQSFRAAYRAHAVVSDGTTTFAGRRVARVQSVEALVGATTTVYWRPGARVPVSVRKDHALYALIEWYIDPATARPVGFSAWSCVGGATHSCKRIQGPDSITRIATFQRLSPTARDLALLTGPNAPAGAR